MTGAHVTSRPERKFVMLLAHLKWNELRPAQVEPPSGIRDEIFLAATVTNLALSRNDSSDLMSDEAA
jgi:hypothetical protein